MTNRYFTLEEAQALVPWLQETFDTIEPLKEQLTGAREKVQSLVNRMQSNGGGKAEGALEEATRALHEAQDGMDERAYTIVERGIVLRDVEQGIVDFTSIRDGREVYLCWRAGEPSITHWHEVDAGFSERQRL